jgi:hypothetical protein
MPLVIAASHASVVLTLCVCLPSMIKAGAISHEVLSAFSNSLLFLRPVAY